MCMHMDKYTHMNIYIVHSWYFLKVSKCESHAIVSDSFWPHGLYSPWNSPGQNTEVGSFALLQEVLNPGLLHCRQILYQLSHKGSPRILEWVAYPFSSRSSQPRNWTRVSCITGRFLTNWGIREAQVLQSHLNTDFVSAAKYNTKSDLRRVH